MNSIKPNIFNYLTKIQKSNLCHFIASFVKKDFDEDPKKLAQNFIEDQEHYIQIKSTRFPFLEEFICEPNFLRELELYISECIKKFKYQEKLKPAYEKQKAYMKEQRIKVKENKMAKELPTKAQISYYKKLCQKVSVENPVDIKNASKLDLRDAIDKILKLEKVAERGFILAKLDKVSKKL